MPVSKHPRRRAVPPRADSLKSFERRAAAASTRVHLVLKLYVAGTSPNSIHALETVRSICQTHLAGRHELEVIDIHQQPEAAVEAQIVAVPTLVKVLPLPLRRHVGSLKDPAKLLQSLLPSP